MVRFKIMTDIQKCNNFHIRLFRLLYEVAIFLRPKDLNILISTYQNFDKIATLP